MWSNLEVVSVAELATRTDSLTLTAQWRNRWARETNGQKTRNKIGQMGADPKSRHVAVCNNTWPFIWGFVYFDSVYNFASDAVVVRFWFGSHRYEFCVGCDNVVCHYVAVSPCTKPKVKPNSGADTDAANPPRRSRREPLFRRNDEEL
jgi:hypothetical protein